MGQFYLQHEANINKDDESSPYKKIYWKKNKTSTTPFVKLDDNNFYSEEITKIYLTPAVAMNVKRKKDILGC